MKIFLFFIFLPLLASANQAQPVPIPEDPSIAPQINITGVGLATLGYFKSAEFSGKGTMNISDSALQFGAAERLFQDGSVGSFALGLLTIDDTNKGVSNPLFLHRMFVDYQSNHLEFLLGRSDNPTAHIVDFFTLRGDDLVTLTNPLNPFSDGKNAEEHRYSNLASLSWNQNLRYYENIHVQHLINSANPNAENRLNSFGFSFQYLGTPGLDKFELFSAYGLGYELISLNSATTKNINQIYAGGVLNLNDSVVNHFQIGFQDIYSTGSNLRSLSNISNSFEANSNSASSSLRYLHQPFGHPSYELALTIAHKKYINIGADSLGFALTGAKRLGHGFDLLAQYLGQTRSAKLASVQQSGLAYEQRFEIGLAFNFDASFNEHIVSRRTLLNQRHHFLSE